MKQLALISISLLLASCASTSADLSSDVFVSGSELGFEAGSSVIFSEFFLGDSVDQRAVEISNYGERDIDLAEYEVIIFHGSATSPEYRIPLSGTLEPNKSYVIKYDKADSILKFDLSTPDFVTNGTWPLALLHNGKTVDVLGWIGNQLSFASDDTVRKNEYRVGREHSEPYDWISFSDGKFDRLGSPDCPYDEATLIQGPRLTQEDFDRPYVAYGETGAGGAVEVSLGYVGDGDTTTFDDLPSDLIARGYSGDSFRYQNIDTPEIDHGSYISAGPWGYPAKYWNNAILRNAKHIVIQSVLDSSLTETYGRLIGYVWYSNLSNPKPEDYINLNHLTIVEGYSKIAFDGGKTSKMSYNGISYYRYFEDANNRGLRDGYKVFGEKDPDFAY
ncbi:MAG: thermonuclease family protein [Bacilli bacterium]|nr:thermonuclease family protein [Bacilli bacterium]